MASKKFSFDTISEPDPLKPLIEEFKMLEKQIQATNTLLVEMGKANAMLAKSTPFEGFKDGEKIVKDIEALNKAQNDVAKNEAKVAKTRKKMTEMTQSERVEQEKLKLEMASVRKEAKEQAKEALGLNDAYAKLAKQSNDAQREFKQLSAEFGVTSVQAQKAHEAFLEVNDQLMAIDKAAKDGRRNVGRYAESMEEFAENSKVFEENAKSVKLFGVSMGDLKNGFNTFKKGIKGGVQSLKTLRGALMATGIGLLLLAFAALQSWLTKTKKGVEVLEVITAGFGAVIAVISEQIGRFGESIMNAFTDPKQAVLDLLNFLKNQLIVRVEALIKLFGNLGMVIKHAFTGEFEKMNEQLVEAGKNITDFATGVEGTADIFADLVSEVKEGAQAAMDLERATQRLADRAREARVEFAKQNIIIQRLEKSYRDVSLSEAERVANLEKANTIIEGQFAERLAMAQEELRIIEEKNAITDSLAEDLDKEADARVKVLDLQREFEGMQQDNLIKVARLKEQFANDEKARIAKELSEFQEAERKKIEAVIARIKVELIESKRGSNEEFLLRTRLIEAEKDLRLVNARLTEDERLLIIKEANKKILDLNKETNQDLFELERQRIANQVKNLDALEDKTLENINQKFDKENQLLDLQLQHELERTDLTELQKLRIKEDYAQREIELNRKKQKEIEALRKEDLVKEKKELDDRLATVNKNIDRIKGASDSYFQKRFREMDEEVKMETEKQNRLLSLAQQGNQDAQRNLELSQKRQEELEKKRANELRRQKLAELSLAAAKTYSAKVAQGDKNPLASTIAEVSVLKAFIESLPAFKEGTESVGSDGYSKFSNGTDGYLARVNHGERIIPTELNDGLPRNLSNTDLVSLVNDKLSAKPYVVSHSSEPVVNELRRLSKKFDTLQMPIASYFDSRKGAIVDTMKKGNKLTREHIKSQTKFNL